MHGLRVSVECIEGARGPQLASETQEGNYSPSKWLVSGTFSMQARFRSSGVLWWLSSHRQHSWISPVLYISTAGAVLIFDSSNNSKTLILGSRKSNRIIQSITIGFELETWIFAHPCSLPFLFEETWKECVLAGIKAMATLPRKAERKAT